MSDSASIAKGATDFWQTTGPKSSNILFVALVAARGLFNGKHAAAGISNTGSYSAVLVLKITWTDESVTTHMVGSRKAVPPAERQG
ncbi:unnamed protein product [Phytophthora lilii]|uniref:Unnamed protein product n=1 Tax=Phytophthora lilii TaxID=2077276 RepID=A0A9W6U4W6_9STRA|nr:unnamed protein product [Phytophthora lilii]